jgi:hypothetical protein
MKDKKGRKIWNIKIKEDNDRYIKSLESGKQTVDIKTRIVIMINNIT